MNQLQIQTKDCVTYFSAYKYHIAQSVSGVKLRRIVQSFDKENVGEFLIANISYFSESGIWLSIILVNNIHFTKFSKVFPRQNFLLYGMCFCMRYHHFCKALCIYTYIGNL